MTKVQTAFVPIETPSASNARVHWAVRHKRTKAQREATARVLSGVYRPAVTLPCVVRLVRSGVRMLDDDNLRGATKGVRDAIAEWLDIDDADVSVRYQYDQDKCKRPDVGVWVTFYSDATVTETIKTGGE